MVDGGGYPLGFVEWAYSEIARISGRAVDSAAVVHLCSGSMRTGIRVDIRPEMEPTIVADCREVPLPDESADVILADPPYSEDYATNLYGTGKAYPKPGEIIREVTRLLRPGGYVGLLHFQVPIIKYPLEMVAVYGISTGMGFAIRAWTLMQKRERGMFEEIA